MSTETSSAFDSARLAPRMEWSETAESDHLEFLAVLSHELRNPLGAISTAAAVLSELNRPDERTARLRAVITRQVRHLTRIVDDLLDAGRLEAGKIVLDLQPVDLKEVADQALLTLRQTGRTWEHDIALRGEPARVLGDPSRLEQVIGNLLDNALKCTPAGGKILVTVEREAQEALLRVRDSGVDIPSCMLTRIFELFIPVDQSMDRSRGGLGLGLALVKRLVEMHGGTASVSSAGPGQGAEFLVRLPLLCDAPAGLPAAEGGPPASSPRHIVLVEDNADARQGLRLLLELQGHRVDEAGDGPRGRDLILSVRPDVALVDVGLPGLDGYAVAQAIRAHPGGRSIQLVALTGYGQEEDRRRAYEAGFDAHLVKPLEDEALRRVLTRSDNGTAGNACSGGAAGVRSR